VKAQARSSLRVQVLVAFQRASLASSTANLVMNARVPVAVSSHKVSSMNTIYKLFFTVAAFSVPFQRQRKRR
jgi:hypothetical protein